MVLNAEQDAILTSASETAVTVVERPANVYLASFSRSIVKIKDHKQSEFKLLVECGVGARNEKEVIGKLEMERKERKN